MNLITMLYKLNMTSIMLSIFFVRIFLVRYYPDRFKETEGVK